MRIKQRLLLFTILVAMMAFNDVTAARRYVMMFPEWGPNILKACCYSNCTPGVGWLQFEANQKDAWLLCKNEKKKANQRYSFSPLLH